MNQRSPVRTILLATSNSGKLTEIQSAMGDLPVRWLTLKDLPSPLPAAEETADTFAGNAIQKAVYYSQATGLWTLADDSGLEVDALGGAPGVRSARYAGVDQDDAANNARLLAELADVPDERRAGRFRCALALVDGGRVLAEAGGVVEGRILYTPRGSNGFGYDPLFFIPAMGCTTAQLTQEQKNEISHRGQAVRALRPLLERLLSQKSVGQ
jgi:XTP/dITP diphosphohydrolase